MKTTGKYSYKMYKCNKCGYKHSIGTNHWGEVYSLCPKCKHNVQTCLEQPPEGIGIPEPWKMVKLSDICEII